MENKNGGDIRAFPLSPKSYFKKAIDIIEWKKLKNINSPYNENYSSIHPLRRVVGLIILDRKLDLGFDILMDNWLEFHGMQYFTVETVFNWERPFSKEEFEEVSSRISKELKNFIKDSLSKIEDIDFIHTKSSFSLNSI